MSWLADTRSAVAAEKILDAAAGLFVRDGVAAVGMNEIARAAGCSRATLYRYFENREALHLAFIHREARTAATQVAAAVADVEDPAERLVDAMVTALELVRGNPALSAWFRPGEYVGGSLGIHSEVIAALVTALLGTLGGGGGTVRDAKWLVRSLISMLSYPEDDPAEERAMFAELIAPMLSERADPKPAAPRRSGGSATKRAR